MTIYILYIYIYIYTYIYLDYRQAEYSGILFLIDPLFLLNRYLPLIMRCNKTES